MLNGTRFAGRGTIALVDGGLIMSITMLLTEVLIELHVKVHVLVMEEMVVMDRLDNMLEEINVILLFCRA